MTKIIEIDCETGIETIRDMTKEELARYELGRKHVPGGQAEEVNDSQAM
jgi:hypothetical protein